ncbi:hypothetical protein N7453_009031 [Penicillium expansum]|nr:hypothetical protein N7453_009031 [Penicillium expansum]
MTSLCKEHYQFMLALGILGGLTDGIMFSPAMAAVSHYFQAKRGAALGITVTSSSLGGVIFPIALSKCLRTLPEPYQGLLKGLLSPAGTI